MWFWNRWQGRLWNIHPWRAERAAGQTQYRRDVLGGRRLGQMTLRTSVLRVLYFSICFHNSPPPHLLLHLHSADILTNACSLASISLTLSVGSPCLHGPGSLLLEGFSLCLIPCLNTSRSKCFWSLVVFPKALPFLFKPSRQISLPIPSKAV